MIWVGVVVEIRIFGELIAYMAVAVGLVLRRGMGRDAPVRTQIA